MRNYFDYRLVKAFSKKYEIEKSRKLSKVLSIIISMLILFLVLFLIIYVLIPKMIVSILGIIEAWPENMKNIEKLKKKLCHECIKVHIDTSLS